MSLMYNFKYRIWNWLRADTVHVYTKTGSLAKPKRKCTQDSTSAETSRKKIRLERALREFEQTRQYITLKGTQIAKAVELFFFGAGKWPLFRKTHILVKRPPLLWHYMSTKCVYMSDIKGINSWRTINVSDSR